MLTCTYILTTEGSTSSIPSNAFVTVDTGSAFVTADTGAFIVTE